MSTSTRLLFRNTMRIAPDRLEEFERAIREAVRFVEDHGPQLLVDVFVDGQRREATSFQLYPDSAAVVRHWELADPYIRAVVRHAEVLRLEVFGEPSDQVRRRLTTAGGPEVSFHPWLSGYRDVRSGAAGR